MPGKGEGKGGRRRGEEGGRGKKSKNTPSVNSCLRPWFRGDIEYFGAIGGGTGWGKVFTSQPTRESVSLSSPAASENGFQCSPNVTECFSLSCLSKIDVQSESVSY